MRHRVERQFSQVDARPALAIHGRQTVVLGDEKGLSIGTEVAQRDVLVPLGQDNVRRLSVTMLIDLFTLERDKTRASEIATDMEALAEDLAYARRLDEAGWRARGVPARLLEWLAIPLQPLL